jgi:hypothetical protein
LVGVRNIWFALIAATRLGRFTIMRTGVDEMLRPASRVPPLTADKFDEKQSECGMLGVTSPLVGAA